MASRALDAHHVGVDAHGAIGAFDRFLHRVPHHSGPEPRIIEFFDQRLDRLLRLDDHAEDCGFQRQVLDALCRPLRLQLGARDSPDLLGIGLEEREKQPFTEAVRHPLLEGVFRAMWKNLPAHVAEQDAYALDDAEPSRCDRNHREHIGETEGDQESDDVGPLAERADEHEQRGRVE